MVRFSGVCRAFAKSCKGNRSLVAEFVLLYGNRKRKDLPKKKRRVDAKESLGCTACAACCETAELRATDAGWARSDPVRARGLYGKSQTLKLPLRHLGGFEGGARLLWREAKTGSLWGSQGTMLRLIYQAHRRRRTAIRALHQVDLSIYFTLLDQFDDGVLWFCWITFHSARVDAADL